MKELLQQSGSQKTEGQIRHVYLYVDATEYEYAGTWQWEMHSDAVFCSDVMLTLPDHFEGTRGIIHPDDKALVQERIAGSEGDAIPFLQFRMITTYGEIKVLTGRNLQAPQVTSQLSAQLERYEWEQDEADGLEVPKKLAWQKRATELAERLTATGTWYYDRTSNAVYYSNEVFRIYGLPRQSLNPHLHTFTSFIHPDDRDLVSDFITRCLREQVPLHFSYRIVTPTGQEKRVRQTTHWEFNERGGAILYGTLQDITESEALEQKAIAAEYDARFKNQLVQLNEQAAHMAHWYMNLVTRKVVYSDSMYRLHGVKPGSLAGGPTIFFNFIHPEDRDIVREVQAKILQQHTLPDIDYRITRPDGKVRHLRQRGRMAVYSEGEMVMLVTLQDITTELLTAQKLAELRQQVLVQQAAQHQSEDMAEMGSWTWEPDGGKYVWSESLYTLLGSKPSTVEITQKHLMQAIHPEDRKRFSEELNLAVQEKRESRFEFRIVRLGEMRHVAASFSLITYGGKDLFLGTLQDITHHTRLQQELEQQARQTSSITDNMLDRVIITDTENTIRVWNRQCEQVYGLKREAVIGKNIFDVFPQLKNETDLQLFNRALAGETISLPASKAALRQEFHDLHMIPLRDDEDNVTGILHLLHDVTKERETQQRLHERLNFIESLMEASVDRILVMDRYMNYLYCNQQAAAYYGLRKDDLIGKNVLEVFPASVNDPTHDHFRRALKGETVHIPAIEGISEEHYYEVFLIPITNDAGTVTAVLWIHHDLSADIRMQKQLRKSDEILNNIQAVFVELDHDLHFRYLNPVAETSIGRPRSELMGRSLVEVFPDVAGTPGYEAIVHANNQHVKTGLEFYSVVFNRWVYMSAAPSADGVLLLFYDRQDIRETQQRLYEEHRRLEEAQVIGKIGSFEWSVGEEEVAWSDEMYRITGLEPGSEPVTLHFTDAFVHPEDYGHLKKLKEDSLHTPGLYQITHRIVLRDGTEKWVHHQFESVAGESGTVVRVHGTLQDITESKEFEKQIRENRELLNTTINSSLDMIQVFEAVRNERGKIVDFRYKLLNEEAKKWMGDAVGESLLQRQPGVVKEGIFDAFRQVVETGIPQQYEKHYAHEQFSGWFYQSVVKLADGVTTTTTNITKRKEAEAQLLQLKDAIAQKATDKYLTLFNSIDEAVGWFEMITDEAGKPVDFRLLEVNPAYSKMSGGLIAQEAVGRRAKELIPDLEPWWIDTFAKVAFGGESMRFEREIKGLNSWFHCYVSPVGDQKEGQFVVVYAEITERKRQEEKQAYLLKLSDATRSLAHPDEILNEALKTVGEYLHLDRVGYNEIDPAVTEYWFRACYAREGFAPVVGRFLMGPFQETVKNLQKDITFIANDAYDDSFSEAEKEVHRSLNVGAYVTVPLVKNGRWVCNLVAQYSQPRAWTNQEIALLEETAERIWAAVERAKAEEALRLSEERLQMALSAAELGTFIWYVADDRTEADSRALAHFGWPPDAPITLSEALIKTFHPDDVPKYRAAVQAATNPSGSGALYHEFRIRRPDGQERWMAVRATTAFEGTPRIAVRLHGVLADVTDRKQAEESLHQAEAIIRQQQQSELFKNLNLLKQAEEVAGLGSWEYCRDDDIMQWSEGMFQLFDLKPGTKISKETYLKYVVKEDRPKAKAVVQQLSEGAEAVNEVLTIETKAGTRKVLRIKGILVVDVGKPPRMLGVDLDITELVKTEETLKALNRSLDQRNKELEAKNNELANFSFIASHDLREPLRKIRTFSDWLLHREQEHLTKAGQDYLMRMSASVQRMDKLIEDVLILTKLHAATFEKEAVDLNAVVKQVKVELADVIKATKAKLTVNNLPETTGIKPQLQYLFKNLILNALTFQKQGAVPQVVIDSTSATAQEIVTLGLKIERAYIKVCVHDNGIGIDRTYHQKIFQIFQRLHARTEYDGTGIGLTICRKVMENHEGTITVESTPGMGATFCCYFPVA